MNTTYKYDPHLLFCIDQFNHERDGGAWLDPIRMLTTDIYVLERAGYHTSATLYKRVLANLREHGVRPNLSAKKLVDQLRDPRPSEPSRPEARA